MKVFPFEIAETQVDEIIREVVEFGEPTIISSQDVPDVVIVPFAEWTKAMCEQRGVNKSGGRE
jgi:prevent-host-death family protein